MRKRLFHQLPDWRQAAGHGLGWTITSHTRRQAVSHRRGGSGAAEAGPPWAVAGMPAGPEAAVGMPWATVGMPGWGGGVRDADAIHAPGRGASGMRTRS